MAAECAPELAPLLLSPLELARERDTPPPARPPAPPPVESRFPFPVRPVPFPAAPGLPPLAPVVGGP